MRIATSVRTLVAVLGATCLAVGSSAHADFTGGKSAKSDCYVVYKGISVTSGKNKVECTDGDPACDTDGEAQGTCSFGFQVCVNDPNVAGCTPSNVTSIAVNGATINAPGLPTSENVCADQSIVAVPLKQTNKGPKKKKLKLKVTATSVSKPKKDKDVITLICNPSGSTTSTTLPPQTNCPANGDPAAGNPNTVVTTTLGSGSDLDNGWTGTSFNFPVVQDLLVTACLSNCDKTTDPICDVNGPTGAGTPNSPTLGPPLPLVAGGVAVCVVNNFQTQGPNGFTGTVNLQTGETTLDIKLNSDVFITDRTNVCPRCETGSCSGGPNKGKPCTVHGRTHVEETFAPNKEFQLSRDCPPDPNQFLARLDIQLAPTTGSVTTPGTGGSKPCTQDQAKGVPAQDDACGGTKCSITPGNCTGAACVSQVPNPVNPATNVCVDAKGGLSQNCCNGQPAVPCHPTFPGGPGITRAGKAVASPTPSPWGDDAYPKTAAGVVMVSTFCEPPTGTGTVDITSGLPGPGAVIFNTDAVVSVTPPTP
jgi:hypothetical protein